jgi:hypothetical protein
MKRSFILIALGSGLTALGFSGWQATGETVFTLAGAPGAATSGPDWRIWAGWTPLNQIEITVGVLLLVCGLMLRRDSN